MEFSLSLLVCGLFNSSGRVSTKEDIHADGTYDKAQLEGETKKD